jgi:sugar phosphate isomerase/epimerase
VRPQHLADRPRVALQLYTLRGHDPLGAVERLAEQGYEGVELYEQHPRADLERLAARLRELGLAACGRHVPLERLEGELEAVALEAELLACPRAVVPSAEPPRDRAEAEALAERLSALGGRAAGAGLELGYHNHWWELEPLPDGTLPLDVLAGLDPALLRLELDLGWAWFAGADPVELLRRHAGRVPLVHAKDFAARERDASCPVGDGEVGYAAVVAAAPAAGVEWLIVEQEDVAGDPFAATARSAAALRSPAGS